MFYGGGGALVLLGRMAESVAMFEQAEQINTRGGETSYRIVQVLDAVGRSNDALSRYRRSARLGFGPAKRTLTESVLGR